jgi:hypothetical protein
MKRFIPTCFYLSLAILLIGATALQANGQRKPKFLKYCSLFDSTFEAKTVSSRALMFYSTVSRVDGGDTFLYSRDCNEPDYVAIPRGDSKVWSKWQNFFDKLPPEEDLTLEIEFEGKPEVATAYLFGSLDGWARAEIQFSEILSIRDVTSLPSAVRPNYEAAKPQIERIEGMRISLREFLQSLYSPNTANSFVQDFLSDDFSFVDSNGKTLKKDQYLKLNTVWTESYAGLKESQTSSRLMSKTTDTMIWRGILKLVFTSGGVKTFYCDVTLALKNGKWILTKAMMTQES